MSAHTPGPWRVDESFGIPQVIAHLFQKGATCVAVVYGDGSHIAARIPGARPSEEFDANARLIAAAPELLAALKLVRPLVVRATDQWLVEAEASRDEGTEGRRDGALSFLEAVDAALAKAGEASVQPVSVLSHRVEAAR